LPHHRYRLKLLKSANCLFTTKTWMRRRPRHGLHSGSGCDQAGKLSNDGTREFLQKFAQRFAEWVETNAK
jgi:hypothetical protein